MNLFFFLVKKIKSDNCINIISRNGLIYCSNCDIVVGLCDDTDEEGTITFINVRENIFKPHTSYSRHSAEKNVQQVSFIERIEIGEKFSSDVLNVSSVLIHPLDNFDAEANQNMPSTSSINQNPIIRVAAFASESLILNQNPILEHFQNAIQNDVNLGLQFRDERDLPLPQSSTESSVDKNCDISSNSVFDLAEITPERAQNNNDDYLDVINLDYFVQ